MSRCSCTYDKYNCFREKLNTYECQVRVIDEYIKIALVLCVYITQSLCITSHN